MAIYINEFDPFAAAWCRELMADGLIPEGDVDERDIRDVQPDDLLRYTQWHFFGGIAGWPYALRLAGWPVDRRILTGSAPCQPFSAAGKQKGVADERHLWPEMFRIIRALRPDIIMGEQVEAAVRLGWLDGVFGDLEGEGYACGAAVLGAHSVGAPHIRQRIYWLADAHQRQRGRLSDGEGRQFDGKTSGRQQGDGIAKPCGEHGSERLDDSASARRDGAREGAEGKARDQARLRGLEPRCTDGRLADADGGITGDRGLQPGGEHGQRAQDGRIGDGMADAPRGRLGEFGDAPQSGRGGYAHGGFVADGGMGDTDDARSQGWRINAGEHTDKRSTWPSSVLIPCADGKLRRVPANEAGEPESSLFPLAHGISNRVGTLRGAGNAIVPQVAAEFIRCYLDASEDLARMGSGGVTD